MLNNEEQICLGLSELAAKWKCSTKTLRRYINKISDKIPFYEKKQRVFLPIQYKVIAKELCFNI